MNLLENELIKKYFGGEETSQPYTPAGIAYNVLEAMQAPIAKGDRVLLWRMDGEVVEQKSEFNIASGNHWRYLRLPDRFQCRCARQDICAVHPELARNVFKPAQEKECGCSSHPCPNCAGGHYGYCEKKPDPVESDIEDISVAINEGIYTHHYFRKRLYKLVELARGTK